MSLERIFEALVNLGLSEPDARVYIFLALKGPKKAKNIIDNLKINKQQILESLKNLQSKCIVLELDTQNGFSVLPFEKVLTILINMKKEQTENMQENLLLNWKAMMKQNSKN